MDIIDINMAVQTVMKKIKAGGPGVLPERLEEEALNDTFAPRGAVLQWIAAPASYTSSEEKLSKWRTALTNHATAPAHAVFFGDSITEGTGASTAPNRWQTIAQNLLRAQVGEGGALFPFIPAYPVTPVPGFPVVREGTVTRDSNWGIGWRTAVLSDETSKVTFTFTGTSAKLMYARTASTGNMLIVVDGGAPVAVSTDGATLGNSHAAVWSTGALTSGTHTVVVTRDPNSTIAESVYIQGLLTFNGDEARGIRAIDAGYHGASSTFLTAGRMVYIAPAITALGTVSLVVIALSTNDIIGPTAPATYRANIERLITTLRTNAGFTGSVALVNLVKPGTAAEPIYAPFAKEMAAIANGDADIAYFDVRRRMPDVPTPYTDAVGLGLFNDSTHPNDSGHAWIGRVMADYLALRA